MADILRARIFAIACGYPRQSDRDQPERRKSGRRVWIAQLCFHPVDRFRRKGRRNPPQKRFFETPSGRADQTPRRGFAWRLNFAGPAPAVDRLNRRLHRRTGWADLRFEPAPQRPTSRRIMADILNRKDRAMSVYMVERDLKGISMEDLGGAQKAAIGKAEEMSSAGTAIRYIRSTFAPDDGRCMCLFDAASEADVKRLNDEAGLPYSRVVPALDLTP